MWKLIFLALVAFRSPPRALPSDGVKAAGGMAGAARDPSGDPSAILRRAERLAEAERVERLLIPFRERLHVLKDREWALTATIHGLAARNQALYTQTRQERGVASHLLHQQIAQIKNRKHALLAEREECRRDVRSALDHLSDLENRVRHMRRS